MNVYLTCLFFYLFFGNLVRLELGDMLIYIFVVIINTFRYLCSLYFLLLYYAIIHDIRLINCFKDLCLLVWLLLFLLMKFRHVVFKLSSGGARQILRLISTGGTQSR